MVIVLIPGLTCDAKFWAHQLTALSVVGDVVVPRLHDFDSLEDMGTYVLDSFDGPLHVVGHSMGGRVAFEMVRTAPSRICSLAVLDTGAHPATDEERKGRQVRLDIAAREGMIGLARDWVPQMIHSDRRSDTELVDSITSMVTSYTVEQYNGQIRALLGRRDAREHLGEITCPTLVACGRSDTWSPVEQHVDISTAIRDARLEIIEDAGHMVSMEQPVATTELLLRWLHAVG